MARRDDREYCEYLREEQRRQPGCPARKAVLDQRGQATSRLARGKTIDEVRYQLSTSLPESETFGLIGQMRRASVSICPNIAEGCGRRGLIKKLSCRPTAAHGELRADMTSRQV